MAMPFSYRKELDAFVEEHNLAEFYIEKSRRLEPLPHALANVKSVMAELSEVTEDAEVLPVLSGTDNFRYKVAITHPYKGNRDKSQKPAYTQEIMEYLVKRFNATITNGQEADDLIGILHMEAYKKNEDSSVICSTDKDLDMLPGWHVNWVKGERYFIPELEALRNFYKQLLTGDKTDNIIGIDGVGPKTAQKMLFDAENEEDMYNIALSAYEKAFKDEGKNRLIENGQLLWIRREHGEYWTPPDFEEWA